MNHANADKSKRLQRFLGVLADGNWKSTREIIHAAEIMAVNSVASEVRANGIKVETRCVGRGRYEYRLPCRAAEKKQDALAAAEGFVTAHDTEF